MISVEATQNFQTLLDAAINADLCLMECSYADSTELCNVICAVHQQKDGSFEFVPLAKLFDGNPYEEIIPPTIGSPKSIGDHGNT